MGKKGIRLRHATLTTVVPSVSLAELAGVTPGISPPNENVSRLDRQRMQGSFQRQSDGAVALQLPAIESKDLAELKSLLSSAFQLGIRHVSLSQNTNLSKEIVIGSAVHADPPRRSEVRPARITEKKTVKWVAPRKRPDILRAVSRRIQTGHGPMTVTLGYDEWGPYEIHLQLGKNGSLESAHAEAMARLITLLLGSGVDPRLIHEQLREIRCPATARDHGEEILSSADAVARVLARELRLPQVPSEEETTPPLHGDEEITVVMEEETLH